MGEHPDIGLIKLMKVFCLAFVGGFILFTIGALVGAGVASLNTPMCNPSGETMKKQKEPASSGKETKFMSQRSRSHHAFLRLDANLQRRNEARRAARLAQARRISGEEV
jgi:hypothetical protein